MLRASIKNILPASLVRILQKPYHFCLALCAALFYRFPSRRLSVIAVTGTKGKTSVTELLNAIFEEAGYTTALLNTVRFKIRTVSEPNRLKMTMPGRFFVQKFLRRAVQKKCTHAIVEMTSEGARQFRHRFISLDALVFTNIAPEHIESHGSYEKYVVAKLSIARALEHSKKPERKIVVNKDDAEARRFLAYAIPHQYTFSLQDAQPYALNERGVAFTWSGVSIQAHDPGVITLYNCLAAATLAKSFDIPLQTIVRAIEKFRGTRGRLEKIEEGQDFGVIVDYAHTIESMRGLYEAFPQKTRICVFGSTGGGRDIWKRPAMGGLADSYCDQIILTNEDPYDEDPDRIVRDIVEGIKKHSPRIEMDRRNAIRRGIESATKDSIVFITGKGTDPYIMGPKGTKMVWDDAAVTREELRFLSKKMKKNNTGRN